MGFKCGIVGLPNVGKSTLFNALTQAGIEAANYPFCTIEPNVGVVPVPDARLDTVREIGGSKDRIPAVMQFVDIAGLVAGASQGEGLGNKFLAHIRETQAIAHVVRCFENDDIIHVAGKINPLEDINTIHTELALADLDTISKIEQRVQKKAKSGEAAAKAEAALAERVKKQLDAGLAVRALSLTEAESELLQSWQLITAKPTLYIANVDEKGLAGNQYVEQVKALAAQENARVVVVCAAIESEISELSAEEQKEFLKDLHLTEPGLNRVIRAGYELLNLETYFTVGPKEARAWTIHKGDRAPQAAGVIHTDFEHGFIRAEVIGYDDFVKYRGEQGAKEAGKWRLEGKEYVVQDGDILLFRFNV